MITRAVPGYFESLKLQEQLDAHIDQVLTPNKEDKGNGCIVLLLDWVAANRYARDYVIYVKFCYFWYPGMWGPIAEISRHN